MSRFKPVHLPADKAIGRSVSVTFGRAFNVCRRAAFLYQLHKGGASTHAMERGSALHRVIELATLAALEQDERSTPPEVVKAIANEVLEDPAYWCPVEEHDYLRECAYRWAAQTEADPESIVAVETLFELDLGGLTLRAKIDRAELHDGGARGVVKDWKSARSLPSFEDIGRKRSDGTIAAKDFQAVAYALVFVFGVPVRESVDLVTGERVETREPFPLADRAQLVEADYVFPGIVGRDGLMAVRGTTLTILELHEYLDSFRALAKQVLAAAESGDWPASYGDHCTECPCQAECPIPAELRRHAGTINTLEDAVEAAEQMAAERLVFDARTRELNNWVKAQPAGTVVPYGRNHVLEVGYQEAEEIIDREAMFEAMERAVEFGEPFDRVQHIRLKKSTPIKRRKLTEAELEERAAIEQGDGDG